MQNQRLGVIGGSAAPVGQTIAQRLDHAVSTMAYQLIRIEDAIARVNGVPQAAQQSNPEKSAATAPLVQSLEGAESLAKRMSDLADSAERIA